MRSGILAFVAVAFSAFGCGGGGSPNFEGEWVYKSQISGQSFFAVRAQMKVKASGGKFHLIVKWTDANPPSQRGTREWICNGEVLWRLVRTKKEAMRFDADSLNGRPFWKMPPEVSPFGAPKFAGRKETVAGRTCLVMQIKGKYQGGDVTLTYWVDKEKGVALKKEHLLKAAGAVLAHEVYECKSVKFDRTFPDRTFKVSLPSGWRKSEDGIPECEVLITKF